MLLYFQPCAGVAELADAGDSDSNLSAAAETPQVERLKVGEGSDAAGIVLIPSQSGMVLEGVETGRGAPKVFRRW